MDILLQNQNFVLVGLFKPAIFDKYFFIKNDFFSESQISDKSIFMDFQTTVITQSFTITILPERIMIAANYPISADSKDLVNIATKFSNIKIPENVINAIGMNFHWKVKENKRPITEISREMLYTDSIPLLKEFFNTNDTAIGMYLSKDIKGARLRLEIKPAIVRTFDNQNNPLKEEEFLGWAFNFHKDFPQNTSQESLFEYINEFDFFKNESQKITSICKK